MQQQANPTVAYLEVFHSLHSQLERRILIADEQRGRMKLKQIKINLKL